MPVPFRKTEKALSNGPCICMGHFCIWGTDPLSRLRRQLVPLFVAWRERVLPGRTLSVAYGDSSPEGRALGKEDKFRPHRSTAGRSLPLSAKLYAFAKAVTERVACRTHTRKNSPRRLRREFFAANAAYFRYLCTARATMPPRMPETRNSATPWTPTSSTTNIKGLDAPLLATRLCT